MIEIALSILRRWWPHILIAVGVIALLVGLWAWDAKRLHDARDEGRAEVQLEFDAYKLKQEQMVSALAVMWAEAIQKVEVRYVTVEAERKQEFVGYRQRAGQIRSSTDGVAVRVPVDALGLLHNAHATANDPGPAGVGQGAAAPVPEPTGDQAGADTTLTDWVLFAIDAAEAYREAADKHKACVEFVGTIRQAGLSQTEKPQ